MNGFLTKERFNEISDNGVKLNILFETVVHLYDKMSSCLDEHQGNIDEVRSSIESINISLNNGWAQSIDTKMISIEKDIQDLKNISGFSRIITGIQNTFFQKIIMLVLGLGMLSSIFLVGFLLSNLSTLRSIASTVIK